MARSSKSQSKQRSRPRLLNPPSSEILLKLGILLGKFQQHRIIEELVHGDILTETLAPAHLQHKLPRQVRRWSRLQRTEQNRSVQWVARHQLPVIEHGHAHGLARRVRAHISLKSKGLHGREVAVHCVERATWLGKITNYVASASGEHIVDSSHAVGRAFYLRELNWFHE